MQVLESTEKTWYAKLKESKNQTDKIMSIVNKVWKVMHKQIIDRSQRKNYFSKNSAEETELKRLLKENEDIRNRRESKTKLLENIDHIFDLWFSKLASKQDADRYGANFYILELIVASFALCRNKYAAITQ